MPNLDSTHEHKKKAKLIHRKRGLSIWSLAVVLAVVVAAGGYLIVRHSRAATACTVSPILVNSCRPWLGAAVGKYPQVAADKKSQFLYHEQRIGRQLDIVHDYYTAGQVLSSDDLYFAKRANTYLFANYKPAGNWADAGGGNATANANIDKMAASVKALGTKKIFMTVWHEPENDVTSGATGCASTLYKGHAGTPAEYRAMWQNVENRFKADGVTNVVWAMDYENYTPFNCMVDDLYPGNGLVDWVTFNAYMGSATGNFANNVQKFITLMKSDEDATHSFSSKPWGIVEWNTQGLGTAAAQYAYYDQAKASLDANQFPQIKFYMIFDSVGPEGNENRIGYLNGALDPTKQAHYVAFANDPKFSGTTVSTPTPTPTPTPKTPTPTPKTPTPTPKTPTPTPKPTPTPTPTPGPDKTAPVAKLTAPTPGAIVSGTINISGTATDNVGVTAVNLFIDGSFLKTDKTAPYSLTLDTTTLTDGTHTLQIRGLDAAGNVGQSATINVTVKNKVATPTPTPVPTVTGDANGDGKVNVTDLSLLESHWNTNYAAADFNHDGVVNVSDLSILLSHWTG